MEYTRSTDPQNPFQYNGYTVQVSMYESRPEHWAASYKIELDGLEVDKQSLADGFDFRSDALENVICSAKAAIDRIIAAQASPD